jgi:hypothetical protein
MMGSYRIITELLDTLHSLPQTCHIVTWRGKAISLETPAGGILSEMERLHQMSDNLAS